MQRLQRYIRRVHVLLLLGAVSTLTGCWNFDGGGPSCDDAMNYFYGQGCVITSGGDPLTLYGAISGCEETKSLAETCGCSKQYDNVLNCLDGIGYHQCTVCDNAFSVFNTCMANCSGG